MHAVAVVAGSASVAGMRRAGDVTVLPSGSYRGGRGGARAGRDWEVRAKAADHAPGVNGICYDGARSREAPGFAINVRYVSRTSYR